MLVVVVQSLARPNFCHFRNFDNDQASSRLVVAEKAPESCTHKQSTVCVWRNTHTDHRFQPQVLSLSWRGSRQAPWATSKTRNTRPLLQRQATNSKKGNTQKKKQPETGRTNTTNAEETVLNPPSRRTLMLVHTISECRHTWSTSLRTYSEQPEAIRIATS